MADLVPSRLTSATVVSTATGLGLNLDGAVPLVHWPGAGYTPRAGDVVRVLIMESTAVVLHPISTTPRPITGTVAGAASSGRVPVTGSDGAAYSARFIGTAPSTGTLVRLDWTSTDPWIWPQAAAVEPTPVDPTPDPSTPAPPPAPPQTGSSVFTATDSGSHRMGSWAQAGTQVIQWRYGSAPENFGAWFYGSQIRAALAGRTITRAQLRLGARLRIGSYNAALALHLQRHTSASKPGGDVARTGAVHDVTLAPNAGAHWVDIPTSMGQALVNSGGGIAISGAPYAGVAGVGDDRASGQLRLDWTR